MMKKLCIVLFTLAAFAAPLFADDSVDFELITDEPKESRVDFGLNSWIFMPWASIMSMDIGIEARLGWEVDVAPFLTIGARADLSILRLNGYDTYTMNGLYLSPYAVYNFSSSVEPVPTKLVVAVRQVGYTLYQDYVEVDVRERHSFGLRVETMMGIGFSPFAFSFNPLTATYVGLQYSYGQSIDARIDGDYRTLDENYSFGVDLRNASATGFSPAFRFWFDYDLSGIATNCYLVLHEDFIEYGAFFGIPINFRTGLWAEGK